MQSAMTITDLDIERCVLDLLGRRAETSSICPSDVARTLLCDEEEWRALMPSVRKVAAHLACDGRIVIAQGRATLNPELTIRGPIRLRRGPTFAASE
ncbi:MULTISPECIES: DUF3253 domain-containing protein [unclassified Caballeronia]|uniref:DUF3253 domain-containing protein n=1 Tax=unclassified Caballeronia TaxID=2646786 RepID=UPI0020290BB1|nr:MULTISPECIES: DUF3253 domain-containing protein [unclassified Caballeronia]